MSKGKLLTTIELIVPPLIAISLLATLFPVSRPAMTSMHPWKIELLASFILLVSAVLAVCRGRNMYCGLISRESWVKGVVLSFGIFLLWSAASTGWAYSPSSAINHTFVWIAFIVFFLFAVSYFENLRSVKIVTVTFIWLIVVLGSLCLVDYLALPDFRSLEGILRIRYGKYAELLVTILPVVWMAAVYVRKRSSFFLITGVGALAWLVVMLSLSKGAFIAGLIGFLVVILGSVFFSNRAFRGRVLTSFGIWLVLTLLVQGSFSLFSPVPSTTDYITGSADSTRETSMFRIFTWKVGGQMVADNWLMGVGADNFGIAVNAARRSFREKNPDDPTVEFGEDYLIERAHNEPLQIAGELGIVGLTLLLTPFLLIGIWTIRTFWNDHFRLSPMLWACIGGMLSFAASSSVSSFSFRAIQNGIAFFLVLAIAVHELRKGKKSSAVVIVGSPIPPMSLRWAVSCVLGLLMIQTVFFSSRGAAEYLAINAGETSDHSEAIRIYEMASELDADYPGLMLLSAWRSEVSGDAHAATRKMRKAIGDGLGTPTTYSTLAKYQLNAGLPDEAERTLFEGISIFPRSVFLRTRLAVLLQNSGKFSDADVQLNAAADVDARQTAGWYNLIRKGGLIAFVEAQKNKDLAQPADLMPISIVTEFLDDPVQISQR